MSLISKRIAIRALLEKHAVEKAATAKMKAAQEAKNRELLNEIASFYEPKRAEAFAALGRHYRQGKIVFDSGRRVSLPEFQTQQRNAYQKRIKSGTSDDVRLLLKELVDSSTFGYTGGRVGGGTPPAKPNLDFYDSRRGRTRMRIQI
jgi:hypothetical protein